jgi:hypothetical protein
MLDDPRGSALKTRLKGVYVSRVGDGIVVTGSASRPLPRGGDSLLGRYLPFRLHPFKRGNRAFRFARQPARAYGPTRIGDHCAGDFRALAQEARQSSPLESAAIERLVREDVRDLR